MIYYGNNCGNVASTYLGHVQIWKGDVESIDLANLAF